MTRRLVGWLLLLPLAVLLVLFALANRQVVHIGFDPFGRETAILPAFDIPLFVLIYTMLIIGVLLGGLAVWLTQGRHRRERRQLRRETKRLGRELDDVRRQQSPGPGTKGLAETDDFLEIE
jgi:uncharacterized integral membrane protein